jgi:hypothetical protein
MTRVFNVEVTGCITCPHAMLRSGICYIADLTERVIIFRQNCYALTPSCPMYQQSFVKDEK